MRRAGRWGAGALCVLGCLVLGRTARAEQCGELHFAFEPDCFRASPGAACDPLKKGDRLQLAPQVAVWLTSADGTSTFVDTMMVTRLVGARGLGNRPGIWNFRSSPKFPYGKRLNALPIWAHARGKLYAPVVMQDDHESSMGFHEQVSSPDPYYCRPMSYDEVAVDMITCPTSVFKSAKGRFDNEAPKVYYPPRNDLTSFIARDCDRPVSFSASCATGLSLDDCCRSLSTTGGSSADKFSSVNDLDAVTAASPELAALYEGFWSVPRDLAPGSYTLHVEVNREFDQNEAHKHEAFTDPQLSDSGLPKNIGQPSVVYEVPVRLDGAFLYAHVTDISGYGDWDGASGTVHPRDATISSSPGSGEGRLLVVNDPWQLGKPPARIHVRTAQCPLGGEPEIPGASRDAGAEPSPAPVCPAADGLPREVADLTASAVGQNQVAFSFTHAADFDGAAVSAYRVTLKQGSESAGSEGGPSVRPGPPGTTGTFTVRDLNPATDYYVSLTPIGRCGEGPPVTTRVKTGEQVFTTLHGCFIATAAYGSALAPAVDALRRARDAARQRSPLAAASIELYYRSSPPVANLLARSESARAAVRAALGPVAELASAVQSLATRLETSH